MSLFNFLAMSAFVGLRFTSKSKSICTSYWLLLLQNSKYNILRVFSLRCTQLPPEVDQFWFQDPWYPGQLPDKDRIRFSGNKFLRPISRWPRSWRETCGCRETCWDERCSCRTRSSSSTCPPIGKRDLELGIRNEIYKLQSSDSMLVSVVENTGIEYLCFLQQIINDD